MGSDSQSIKAPQMQHLVYSELTLPPGPPLRPHTAATINNNDDDVDPESQLLVGRRAGKKWAVANRAWHLVSSPRSCTEHPIDASNINQQHVSIPSAVIEGGDFGDSGNAKHPFSTTPWTSRSWVADMRPGIITGSASITSGSWEMQDSGHASNLSWLRLQRFLRPLYYSARS